MFVVPESDTRVSELETVQAVLNALPSGMNTDHSEVEDVKGTTTGRMSTTKTAEEKTERTQPTPGPSKKSAREESGARRRCETVDSIRLLQEALPLASDSTISDCSTIGNTSTAESAAESAVETEVFQLPSARRQRKRKSSRNSSSESERRKRSRTKPATAGDVQPANAAKDSRSIGSILANIYVL
ncbi:hypothetical protein Trydic_g21998 [Trypoxylus dichotomus]